MKRNLLLLSFISVLLTFLIPFSAGAETSGICGTNLTWALDDRGTLTINGTGEMTQYSSGSSPWYSLRSSIKVINISQGVSSIGARAFQECTSLSSIIIPDGVTFIGDRAFEGCSSLSDITIPSSVFAIGSYAFSGCASLTSISLPDTITSIGKDAFLGCTSLSVIEIPDAVTSIGSSAFQGCSSLPSIIIPVGVTHISSKAFKDCTTLATINLSTSVGSVADGAFWGCTALTTINYEGSENDFSLISIDYGNDPLENATINYNVQIPKITSTKSTCISNKITVVPHNVKNGSYIVVACYNGKKLAEIFPMTYNGEESLPFNPDVAFDRVAVMVWESDSSLTPLCAYESVIVK